MQEKSTRYRQYSEHLQRKFGHKVYKLPVNLPGTCPNRMAPWVKAVVFFVTNQEPALNACPIPYR
ncbi:hypothetical protein N752_18055 [Desulforamulus aquiferis]|nr:hypothetical protein N752_18055 [Desulforamulus aquiferis]